MFATPIDIPYIRRDIRSTDRVTFPDGMICRANLVDDKGQYFHPIDDPDFCKFVSHEDVFKGIQSGDIRIEEDYFGLRKTQFRQIWGDLTITDLTPNNLLLMRHKRALIDKYTNVIDSCSIRITAAMLEGMLKKWTGDIEKEKREKLREEEERLAAAAGKKRAKRSHKQTTLKIFENAPTAETFLKDYERWLYFDKNDLVLTRKQPPPGCIRNTQNHSAEALALAMQWSERFFARDKAKKKPLYREYMADLHLKRGSGEVSIACTQVTYDQFDQMIMRGATYDRVLARWGAIRARRDFRPLREGFDITRPGELVQFDDHECDLAVWLRVFKVWEGLTEELKKAADTLRVWITVGVDVATGYIVALKMSTQQSVNMVLEAIEMAVSDKTHLARLCGAQLPWLQIPISFATSDNGWNYIDEKVAEAASGVGINWERGPAEQPWLRGTCERTMRLLSELVLHGLPGKTFANVIEKGDYKPEENAGLLAEEFYALLVRLVVDYHHLRISGPRRVAAHNAVAKYLQETRDGARKLVDLHQRRHVFGVPMKCAIHADGIIVWGIRYNSDQLQLLRGAINDEKISIKSHLEDLRWISAQLPDRRWITVRNQQNFEEPVHLLEWIKARKDLISEAETDQVPFLDTMFRALAHRREVGDSAILAANLTMHRPTREEILQHHKVMFEGINFEKRGPLARLPQLAFNGTELLKNSFRAIKAAVPVPSKLPEPDQPAQKKNAKKIVNWDDDYEAY